MAALQPGQMLGQYQITSQIGKGGMATVYKAYQASMDRYVALKVVSGQVMDDPNFLKRFTLEAHMIAKLEHPHILPVHDFGEADGTPYMVMRFIEAGTLTEMLEAGQLPLSEIDRIFSQLTEALGYAHEQGIIHRDIKPSNAMLDKRGDVFLTDFGIAKMVEGTAGLTATGAITGTPSYMSPEQAQGNKADQRSDIYSLGIVLFEMLTGRVPFEAETPMAVLFKQILDPPPPLSVVRPDLPYTLEIVLLKALSKKPEDRYPSMAAFRTAWKKALVEAAEVAAPVAPAPVVATQNRTPTVAGAVATPAAETVSLAAAAPVKKGFNWGFLAIGIVAGLVVCVGLAAAVIGPWWFGPRQAQPEPTKAGQPSNTAIPFNHLKTKGTTSWAAANSIFTIAFRGADEVLTAGYGGVTVWKPDGSHQQLTTADGLPSANTSTIFVDTDDSLWVGSDAGLAHLVPGKSTIYTTEQGLDANYVFFVTRTGGRLFASTQYAGGAGDGLHEFVENRWKHLDGFPSSGTPDEKTVSSNVREVLMDSQSNLWVTTDNGLAMLDASKKWHVFKTDNGLPDNSTHTVFSDSAGNLWVGTSSGGVAKFDPSKQAFESFADLKEKGIYEVYAILEDKAGNFWFAGGDVARYNPKTEEWTVFNFHNSSLPIPLIDAANINDQGVLYFGSTENGLLRYANEKFEKLQVQGMPHYGQYGYIMAAPDGKLVFVHLYESGIDQFNPATGTWEKILQDKYYVPRAFDAKGQMWSGGSDGLWISAPDKTTHLTTELGLPSNRVSGVAFNKDGNAFIGTNAGIALFDGLKVKEVYTAANNELLSDDVHTLFMASDGSLWASMFGGFSRRLPDGTWQSFQNLFDGSSSQYFPAFAEDRQGNIWVTTAGDGLYLFSNGKWSRIRSTDPGVGLPSNDLTGIVVAPDDSLWIGSVGQGLVRYDGKNWKHYGLESGLIDLHVNWLYAEPSGAIWLATNGGITRLEP